MKKLKLNVSSLLSKICTATVAVLGYSCSSEPKLMYGTPTASFEVKGIVTDEEGNPVEDATIKITEPWYNSNEYSLTAAKSNADGRYEYESGNMGSYQCDSLKIVCVPDNLELAADSVNVRLKFEHDGKHDKMHKKDFMYIGHADVTANFKLKKKQ